MTQANPDERPTIAAAIVVDQGKVLLVKRRVAEKDLSWQFPAGAVLPNESDPDGATREAFEETGMVVSARSVIGERVHPNTGRRIVYVACDVVGGTATVNDAEELSDVVWCPIYSLATYIPAGIYGPVADFLRAETDVP